MSVCSEFSFGRKSEWSDESLSLASTSSPTSIASLPVLSFNTSSASRKSLLKKEFQQNFGRNGSGAKYYGNSLKTKKKKNCVAIAHAHLVLEYEALDRWLRKRNMSGVSTRQMTLSQEEFAIFFKWFDMKMKRYSHEDGLDVEYIITDFVESGLFKRRAEASHFLKSIDSDGNGSISCEEFSDGLSCDSNLHRVVQFKRFIRKINLGETLGPNSLPYLQDRPATAPVTSLFLPRSASQKMGSTM